MIQMPKINFSENILRQKIFYVEIMLYIIFSMYLIILGQYRNILYLRVDCNTIFMVI
jgi:hypothetical protein